MIDEMMVSINCLVYNHEPYLRQCLDGFVMQKTNFKFEVLIHDDASTDKSVEIIREYEQKYPDIIKPIYQNENQYSKGVKISLTYQYPRAKGKYLAICEGDDYWTDPYKLQKQFDAMEAHPECSICVHKVRVFDDRNNKDICYYPVVDIKNNIINIADWICGYKEKLVYFHTTSYFVINQYLKEYVLEKPKFMQIAAVGDVPLLMYLSTKGDIYYINEVMSDYRMFSNCSWTSNNEQDIGKKIYHFVKASLLYSEFDTYLNYTFHFVFKKRIKQINRIAYILIKKNKCKTQASDDFIRNLKKLEKLNFFCFYVVYITKKKVWKILRLDNKKGNK